ncbi:MAG: peroxidase-related enzyme [Halieaceae bacterium]|uniref:peroxidase-related enzyme n=1 Tax=Haliea alexandrii TaxID=2448162 RepID=UPI000F0B9C3B|nr:peroxidase-related enzyme [Haliea alexandrii]MCR9184324.1 peroxidase-related enzyme [Halieaceae bacterium]
MLNCREISQKASHYLDGELSWRERMAVRVHLLMCDDCRRFVRQLAGLIRAIPFMHRPASPEEVETVLDHVNKRLEDTVSADMGPGGASTSPARPRLRLVQGSGGREEDGGSDEVEAIFDEIRTATGSVSNMFRAYARHPAVLLATWARVKSVMLQGTLPQTLKEAIALVISHDNACTYCVEHHSRNLAALGMGQEEIGRLLADPLAGSFTPKERALLVLARQANGDPHGASVDTLDVARRTGASDLEIIEALAVMELFTSLNRFLNTLDIPLEGAGG